VTRVLRHVISLTNQCICCSFATSPARAMAKYCDEHVCLSVCVSVCLSVCPRPGATRAIFTKLLCVLPMVVARSSGRVAKSKGDGQFWGFSSQLTMHCNAFAAKGINREGGDGGAQRGRSVIYAIALTSNMSKSFVGFVSCSGRLSLFCT